MLNITLVGGGNSTHVLAALAAEAGHNVSILTRRVGDWASDRVITMQNSDPGWLGGTPKVVGTVVTISSDTEALISGADVIVLAGLPCSPVPPHARADLPAYQAVGRHARFAACLGGFSWLVKEAMGQERASSVTTFGCQSIPWTCGLVSYGTVGP